MTNEKLIHTSSTFTKVRRSESAIKTFQIIYGTKYKYLPIKVKKGFGKRSTRFQKVIIKSNNTIDNLTWCK